MTFHEILNYKIYTNILTATCDHPPCVAVVHLGREPVPMYAPWRVCLSNFSL